MAQLIELRINRNLLDTSFEGYKLSLDPVAIQERKLDKELSHIKPSDEYYSFHHAKLFGLHNHLIKDPWNPDAAYFIADGTVFHMSTDQETGENKGVGEVWEFPVLDSSSTTGRYNYTLRFASAGLCVASDGTGNLYLVHTGDRHREMQWKLEYSFNPVPNKKPFSVIHALHNSHGSDTMGLQCLLLRVEQRQDVEIHVPLPEAEDSSFVTLLEWVTFDYNGNTGWSWSRIRRLAFAKGVDFATLLPNGDSVAFIAQEPYAMVYDSLKPPEIEMKDESEEKESKPDYLWCQTPEDLTIYLNLPPESSRHHIKFEVHPKKLHVSYKGISLLDGELGGTCQPDSSTYILTDQKLEILLTKAIGGEKWGDVVVGDARGEETVDPSIAAEIHERLAHLTSEKLIGEDDVTQRRGFNSEQLEECDLYSSALSFFCRMNGETHAITHKASVGSYQILFWNQIGPDMPPAVCLRYDVDGVLWQPQDLDPAPNIWKVEHIATFPALGYVQASKEQRKFTSCPEDFSYAVICDSVRHVYIYRQPSSLDSDLRNRNTGKKVNRVARQQVVAIEGNDEILGLHATRKAVIILTSKNLYTLKL